MSYLYGTVSEALHERDDPGGSRSGCSAINLSSFKFVFMPFPIIGAATAAIGAYNAIAQGRMNAKNRKWSEQRYDVQRKDALSDWAMQNEYNSPQAQMQRLKAAGLNPNMVYGSGTVAGNASSAPHETTTPPFRGEAPQLDPGSVFAPLDMEIKRQQLENLKTQKHVMNADIIKKTADVGRTGIMTERGKFDLGLAQDLRDTTLETASANLRSVGTRTELAVSQIGKNLADLDITRKYGAPLAEINIQSKKQQMQLLDAANARAESTNLADLRIKAQQVINMLADRAKTDAEKIRIQEAAAGIRRSNTLQDIDIHMKSAGFDWRDPVILRQLRMSSRGYSK